MGRLSSGSMRIGNILPMTKLLRNMAIDTPEPEPKPEKKWIAKLSKEQILDLRTKYEYEHWTVQRIMAHFEIPYHLAKNYINYITQRDLIPKKPK